MDQAGYDIKGKVALVTGAAGGIGAAISEALLAEGVKGVALCDVNEEDGKTLCSTFAKTYGPEKMLFIKCNVLNHSEIESAFEQAVKCFGQLDIVLNNAGIFNEIEVSRVININLTAVILGTQIAIEKYLPKYKSSSEGVILNTASILGLTSVPFAVAYCAAKHGVLGLGKCYGTPEVYNKTKVRVMSICPSFTDTNILKDMVVKEEYQAVVNEMVANAPLQTVRMVGAAVIHMIKYGKAGSVWIVNKGAMEEANIIEAFNMADCS